MILEKINSTFVMIFTNYHLLFNDLDELEKS